MKSISILLLSFLCACTKPMTNDQIIAEINKCKAAGLGWYEIPTNGFTLDIGRIVCTRSQRDQSQ